MAKAPYICPEWHLHVLNLLQRYGIRKYCAN